MSSAAIEAEYSSLVLRRSVRRYLLRRQISPGRFLDELADYRMPTEIVEPVGEPPLCRDEDDRTYLHCAVTAGVDYLVTLDQDLLTLEEIEGIPIVNPEYFVRACLANGWPLWTPQRGSRPSTGP